MQPFHVLTPPLFLFRLNLFRLPSFGASRDSRGTQSGMISMGTIQKI